MDSGHWSNSSQLAIQADNVFVTVKQSWQQLTILNGLSLTVPKGCVYGLIGPSGCGKTTFQRCLLGQHCISSGLISVMGHYLGVTSGQFGEDSAGQEVTVSTKLKLGPMFGYMPQDIALDIELTIDEMVTFFGRLYGLTLEEINNQLENLSQRLDISLDLRRQKIDRLSLGTRRRVSLVCALLHSPELLLLDEPTVGSDPIAVDKIWKHLLHLRTNNKMTIVLTTHYLEEVNKADYFAFMSQGKVIIEDIPEQFKAKQNSNSLESAILFYYMSKKFTDQPNLPNNNKIKHRQSSPSSSSPLTRKRLNHLEAFKLLTWRYWSRWKAFTLYQFLGLGGLLICVLFTMGLLFGHFPKGLRIGVVNHDVNGSLSNRYIESLISHSNDWLIVSYLYESDARNHLESNRLSGYLVIGEKFSQSFTHLGYLDGIDSNLVNQSPRSGTIVLTLDYSNRFISDSIEIVTTRSLINLTSSPSQRIENSHSIDGLLSIEPIYRWPTTDDLKFLAPTKIVLVKFLFHVIESFSMTLVMLIEVYEHGYLVNERLSAGGLQRWELIVSMVILSTGLLLPTYLIAFTFIWLTIDIPVKGGIIFIFGLTLALIISGIIKGLFIGSLTRSPVNAVFLQCSYGFTGLFCGAVLWPYQSLPYFIKPLNYFFPYTQSGDSAVKSMIYGQSITDQQVYMGLVYSWFHVIITLIVLLFFTSKWRHN